MVHEKFLFNYFLNAMQYLIVYHYSCKHPLSLIMYPKGSTNTLHSNSCNSRPCEPNFIQLAGKTNNALLFRFTLFSHHISVATSHNMKCLSLYWPSFSYINILVSYQEPLKPKKQDHPISPTQPSEIKTIRIATFRFEIWLKNGLN